MQIVTRLSVGGLLAGLFAAAALVGGSADSWDWGRSNKKETPPKPVTKPQPASRPAKQAGSEPAKASETNPAADPEADRINAQIAEYTDRMKTDDRGAYEANDINAKIQRQQDPNRRNRIRKVAEDSKSPPATGAGFPEPRPSAVHGLFPRAEGRQEPIRRIIEMFRLLKCLSRRRRLKCLKP